MDQSFGNWLAGSFVDVENQFLRISILETDLYVDNVSRFDYRLSAVATWKEYLRELQSKQGAKQNKN